MNQLRHVTVAVVTAALIGGWVLLPTVIPIVGTAVAQEQDEEEIQMKRRGKKRGLGQVSKPGLEKQSERKQGIGIQDKRKNSEKKVKSKKKKSKKKAKRQKHQFR